MMLAPAPSKSPGSCELTLAVEHLTRYDYSLPVSLAHHQAHLQPLADSHQALLEHSLQVEPLSDAALHSAQDAFGNFTHWFSLSQPHQHLQVRAQSRLRIRPRFAALQPAGSPTCADVALRLRYAAGRPFEPAVEFVQPSPYIPRLQDLRDWSAPELDPQRPLADAALALMHRLHRGFEYRSASTQVETPLQKAFEQRRGVCQDFAHLLIGMLRMAGLAARYVSGYLLTSPPEGQAPLVGADASHAWVQLWCPDTPGVPDQGPSAGWLDLDPTNDRVPATDHVRLAIGRDFGDVTPLRGVIRGGGRHSLQVGVTTMRC